MEEKLNKIRWHNDFKDLIDKFDIKNLKSFSYIISEDSKEVKSSKTELDEINDEIEVISPIDGTLLCKVKVTNRIEYEQNVNTLKKAQQSWKMVPAPKRGDLIRLFADELRKAKSDLGKLVTIETGKILQEGLGEVQEMIDICDFAVGLSRQLYGLTMPSERSEHRIQEIWHPLGIVGIVTSFNFPIAVWSWNFALATICGNATLWKPSPKTPLTAMACYTIWQRAVRRSGLHNSTEDILKIINGHKDQAEWLSKDKNHTIDTFIAKKYNIFVNKLDELEGLNQIDENILEKFNAFAKNYQDAEAQKNTKLDIMLMIYNNKDKINMK